MPKNKIIRAADLFCGAGGTSTGLVTAVQALGMKLDLLAVNHWSVAVDTHAENHRQARHLCQQLEQIDPRKEISGGMLDILVASPECTHHSNARGGKPVSDQKRSSAWNIANWLEKLFVANVLIENVPEFRGWGPLDEDGYPIKERKGELYQLFLKTLNALGYEVEDRVLNAADYGDATTRRRLFIMGKRSGPIVWPIPTHIDPKYLLSAAAPVSLKGRVLAPWKPARDIINWDIPGKSIYDRKKPLAENTMQRIFTGLKKFCGLQFIVPQFSSGSPKSVDDPLGVITTTSRGIGLAQPYVVVLRNHGDGRSIELPLPAVCAGGTHLGVAEPFVMIYRNFQDGRSIDTPVPAFGTSGAHLALIEPEILAAPPFISRFNGSHKGRGDGADRNASIDDPLSTLDTSNRLALVSPYLIKHYGGKDAAPLQLPLPTVTANYNHLYLAQPFLVKFTRTGGPRSLDLPIGAITTRDQYGLVEVEVQVIGKLDIRFRMLEPEELAAAMSFPREYSFTGNREQRVKQIGNAVPCKLAEALCKSLLAKPARIRRKAA